MFFQKLSDRIPFMPSCSVNIQPDRVAAKSTIQVLQYLEKPLAVTSFRLDHPCATEKRSYPPGNIQTFLMLTGCHNLQPFTNERPTPAQPGMQGEAAFILENNGFLRPQRAEFFLNPSQTSLRPQPLPGDRCDPLASAETQDDASSTAPGELSTLPQTAAGDESPMWGRPTEPGSIRTSGAIPPDGAPPELQSHASIGLDDPAFFLKLRLPPHPYLPPGSNDLYSSGSARESLISTPVADLPIPKEGSRSLFQPKPRVFSWPRLTVAPWKLLLNVREVFSCPHYNKILP